jgi:DnaJ-class molecular chaperone
MTFRMRLGFNQPLDDDFDESYTLTRCAECNGSGSAPEGWDCEECDGEGGFEL